MDRVAVFIDAGYLFAAGSTLLAGHKLRRGETRLDEVAALAFFDGLARATGLPLLRITKAEIGAFLTQVTPIPITVPPPASSPPGPPLTAASVVPPSSAVTTGNSQLGQIAVQVATAISKVDSDRVANDITGTVPRDIDQQLLRAGRTAKGASLEEHEKRELRRLFIQACNANV